MLLLWSENEPLDPINEIVPVRRINENSMNKPNREKSEMNRFDIRTKISIKFL